YTRKGKSASKKVVFREDRKDASPTSNALRHNQRQSSREKDRPLKKQKVGLLVAESSETSPSHIKRLSVAKPRRRGSIALLCSTLKNFNDAQKAAVREMGFGHLFSWDVNALPYTLCGNGLANIPINDLIVEQYLGLPRGHHQFDTSCVNSVQVKSWRVRYPENKVVNYVDVARRLTDSVNVDNTFYTDFAVLFYSLVIVKTANGSASSKFLIGLIRTREAV
ncbi:hypothetical protein V2J09_021720, partial [Rumex salicifolius]